MTRTIINWPRRAGQNTIKDLARKIEQGIKENGSISIPIGDKRTLDLLKAFYKVTIEPFGYVKFEKKQND